MIYNKNNGWLLHRRKNMLLKGIASAIIIYCLTSFSVAFAEISPNSGGNFFIPKGTRIAVELVDSVSSKETFVGETLVVKVLEDYIVHNVVIIERGSKGFVSVIDKKRSGEWGKSGGVAIQPQYLKTANWVKVPLDGVVATSGEGHAIVKPFGFGAAGISGLIQGVTGVGGAFATLLLFPDPTRGGDATIPAGTKLIFSVSENTDLGITADELVKAMTIEPIRREGGNLSIQQGAATTANFSGQWMTSKGKVTLYQAKGSQIVTGQFERTGGTLRGTVQGNSLTGRWKEDPDGLNNEMGPFELLLSGNGEHVMFLWKRDYAPNWSQDRFANKISDL
jgi:hypothetical protein